MELSLMIQEICSLQNAFKYEQEYKPYISSIVFQNYKNLLPSEELTLDFPLTLLIGKNGTNKSSILHALYGCPKGKSTGEYWFSIHTDPIDKKDGKRAAYFYRYTVEETGDIAEVLKTRIKKEEDPDYWEPSRPVLEYGMSPLPEIGINSPGRSKTRWNAISKTVVYLDFRAEISAFDKAFYKNKKNRIRHRSILRKQSKPLKEAIEGNLSSKIHHKKERIYRNHKFTEEQREIVNKILDVEYSEIIYIEHDFYLSGSFSVYLKKGEEYNYSEAFAGSGETSIIRLVYAIDEAPNKALMLLDEPETSLHIEAQYRLKDFILLKIKEKKLQVVISTHSPFFANGLPECAIKVLIPDPLTKKIKIINSSPADESSFHLGYRRSNADKISIIMEDKLGQALAMHVSNKHLQASQRDKIKFEFRPGGVTAMFDLAASEMLRDTSSVFFLFDGDQKPSSDIPDPSEIPESENSSLETRIKEVFGSCPRIPMDSNNMEQRVQLLRSYLSFARERFRYLPCATPEEFIVKNHPDLSSTTADPKTAIKDYVHEKLASTGEVDANSILCEQRRLLSEISDENPVFAKISEILIWFANHES
jgi:predicted ATPase